MQKKNLLILVTLFIVSFFWGGVAAYFTTETPFRGIITTGKLSLKVHQVDYEGKEILKNEIKIMPGDELERIIFVENTGNQSMYLRIKLITKIDDENLEAQECISADINNEYWQYKDGYYYYKNKLEPGKISEELFSKIIISGKNVDNRYLGKTLIFDVVAQATQVKNNSNNALDAYGWPA